MCRLWSETVIQMCEESSYRMPYTECLSKVCFAEYWSSVRKDPASISVVSWKVASSGRVQIAKTLPEWMLLSGDWYYQKSIKNFLLWYKTCGSEMLDGLSKIFELEINWSMGDTTVFYARVVNAVGNRYNAVLDTGTLLRKHRILGNFACRKVFIRFLDTSSRW